MTRPSLMTLVALTVCLCCNTAYGIDFITQDRFKSDTGGYKDYPFRVLFQKLAQSQGEEKKRIRSAIIQKQVFDRNMQRRVAAGTVSYQRSYGVVREISEEHLVLWDAQSEAARTFHTGLLAIPTLNPEAHEVSEFNLSRFAVVVHHMDDRVYQLEIGFPVVVPKNLELSREGSKNLLRWAEPSTVPKPVGYHVHVGGALYKSIEETALRIPRKQDQADEYTVRAVYRHGPVLVESEPSATLFDRATASEVAEKHQAEQAFALMLSTLNPASWESARRILNENLAIFSARLDGRQQALALGLTRFFADIDSGDSLSRMPAVTAEQMARAGSFYQSARQKALALEPAVKVSFIADLKIEDGQRIIDAIESRTQSTLALQTWERIIIGLTTESWPRARQQLFDNREFLLTYLNPEAQAQANRLIDFFSSIDAGDRFIAMAPSTLADLEKALASYQEAENKASVLAGAGAVAVGFIAQEKQQEAALRIDAIQAEAQLRLLQKDYQQVVTDLTPARWPEARRRLDARRDAFLAQLPAAQQVSVAGLVTFFSYIDSGDRLMGQAADAASLVMANGFYEKAAQTAAGLTAFKGLVEITRQKRLEGDRRLAALKQEDLQTQASRIFKQVQQDLTPARWPEGRQLLDNNRRLLEAHLPAKDRETFFQLARFFDDIDAGDNLAATIPVVLASLERAQSFYAAAGIKAEALAGSASVDFIVAQRRSENARQVAAMIAEGRSTEARQIFERALSDLNPADWAQARTALYDHRELLENHLEGEQRVHFDRLLAIFSDIARGDRFGSLTPPTMALIENALSAYGSAATRASALSAVVDLSFLTQPKIEKVNRDKAAMLASQDKSRGETLFGQIVGQLTPSQWISARELMVTHGPFLQSILDGERRDTLMAIARFFSEIEEGDRLGAIRPVTRANLKNAAMFYDRADEKAAALPASVDVGFLPKMRLNEIAGQLAELEALERRLAEQVTEKPGEEPVVLSALTGKEAVKFALKNFKTGNYSMALQGFSQVYHTQINMMRKRGMSRLQGVMGLPDKYRAEIVFVAELEALLAKRDTQDEFARDDAIQNLSARILEGRGMWGIISQDRRDKMASRLENITFETEESE